MSTRISASIDCCKISKKLLIQGKKGIYIDIVIWLNDSPDQYGNDVSIEQKTAKGTAKIYLGNGKIFKQATGLQAVPDLPASEQPEPVKDDLPF